MFVSNPITHKETELCKTQQKWRANELAVKQNKIDNQWKLSYI
jgi:hypothetical protein